MCHKELAKTFTRDMVKLLCFLHYGTPFFYFFFYCKLEKLSNVYADGYWLCLTNDVAHAVRVAGRKPSGREATDLL